MNEDPKLGKSEKSKRKKGTLNKSRIQEPGVRVQNKAIKAFTAEFTGNGQ
jgi:hypothetical protein